MYYYTPTIKAFLEGFTSLESEIKESGFEETHIESLEPLEIDWNTATEEQLRDKQALDNRRLKASKS